ncbi:MAG: hypothetical protein LUQ65_09875, partial [Candidatus Helarchaeota archaeon]|nr:hypothetical protein [Candidatus Helarchaeota archaeon]
MAQESISTKSNSSRRMLKLLAIAAIILFPVALILGFCFNFVFYAIITYTTIILSLIGYFGGTWLWEYLATSELLKGNMKRNIKMFGVVVLAGFVFIISFSLYTSLYGDPSIIQSIVSMANYLILFLFIYCIGYLISIWRIIPPKTGDSNADLSKSFKLDWKIIKGVLKLAIPSGIVIGIVAVILGICIGQLLTVLFYYGIIVLLLGG